MPIANPATPFYAVVGAGDALVERVRATDPSQLKDLKAPKLKAPQVKAPQLDVKEIPAQLKALPEQLRDLQGQAQSFASETLEHLSTAYADFAKRGETVVDDVRKRDVVSDVKDAVSKLRPATEAPVSAPAAPKTAETKVESPKAEPKPAAKKPAAKKSTAKKSTAKTTAAKKSTAKKSSTAKSTAKTEKKSD